MRHGCISLGNVKCDGCQRIIPYPERYLVVEETRGVSSRLCIDCSQNRGYAQYKQEKGEQVLTFFVE